MTAHIHATDGPLSGLLVVDLSRALAGPHASMMLGDQGARVIKVESPHGGDDTRGWGPPFVNPGSGVRESSYFLSCNRNKESITLDLKSAEDIALLRRLVQRADVLVENFRTGVLDRLGLSMDALLRINPRLVILSITGFGHDGPDGGRAGYDQIVQAEAGLMSLTGPAPDEPTKVGVPIADLLAGMYGAFGVVSALLERQVTGRGGVVRTSLLAGVVGVHGFQGTRYTVAGELPGVSGQHHPSICPYGLFRASDGAVLIAVGSESLWGRFAELFGLDRPEWESNSLRLADRESVIAAVDEAFSHYGRTELMTMLARVGVPAGQVRTLDEVYGWDQVKSQALIVEVEHQTLGRLTLAGSPLRYDRGGRSRHLAPPTLGQHDESVRSWLDALDTADEQLDTEWEVP